MSDDVTEAKAWMRTPDGTALLGELAASPAESGLPHAATLVRAALAADTETHTEYRAVRNGTDNMAYGEGDAGLAKLRGLFRLGVNEGRVVIEARTVTPWTEQT